MILHLFNAFLKTFFWYFLFLFFFFLTIMYRFVLIALCVIIVESKLIYTKVAVLGAGAAGIASAKTLSLHNQSDFVIIDAQSFIGGKLKSIRLFI